MSVPAPVGDVAKFGPRLKHSLLTLVSAIPVLMVPALEWLPGIPKSLRTWIILVGLAVAAVGFFFLNRRDRRLEKAIDENRSMKAGIEKAEPEYFLKQISTSLFREGAWRLTVYKKEYSPDSRVGDHLVKLASVASDGDQRDLGPSKILILSSTMFEFSFRSNLADPKFRRPEQSGHSPEEVHSQAWNEWREEIFGRGSIVDDASTFRARKIAWYAAQEPVSQAIFVAIAESSAPEGIVVDYLDHSLTPAWLFFVAQTAELKASSVE